MHIRNGLGITAGAAARLALTAILAFGISGCKTEDKKADVTSPVTDTGGATGGTITPSPTGNTAPKISGTPVTTAKVSVSYVYQPKASDPDGDRLSFQVRSKPDWATFDASTGRLEGTPPAGSTGTYTGVQIVVTDGSHTAESAPFSITVVEPAIGSAELAWQAPTTNEDGSALVDLSGYVIRYGQNPGALDQSVKVGAGITMYVVDSLVEGTWYFSLSSVSGSGVESRPTGYVTKTIG